METRLKSRDTIRLLGMLLMFVVLAQPLNAATIFYVATNGRDAWSGRLAEPNAGKTDGPFATLVRGRDAVRAHKAKNGLAEPVTVLVREGCYYFDEPLILTPPDSGTEACPITYRAHPGEHVVLSGGRPVVGWAKAEGQLWAAAVPEGKAAVDKFQQLFVAGKREIRARHPNFDEERPRTGGFLFAKTPDAGGGAYSGLLTCMYPGDWSEYDFECPRDGTYYLWMRYAAQNEPFGTNDIGTGTRTSIRLDGGERVYLRHLPDTGGWHSIHAKWAPAPNAVVRLTRGRHVLRWTNDKGPGLDTDAMVFVNDPEWRPKGIPPTPPAGRAMITIHAEAYDRIHGDRHAKSAFGDLQKVYFAPGKLKAWPNEPQKMLFIWVFQNSGMCSNALLPIDTIDEARREIRLQKPFYRPSKSRHVLLQQGARFFVENVRDALDAPGEWFFDTAEGKLLYWPRRADFAKQRIVLSNLRSLVELNGEPDAKATVHHINFEGFVFEGCGYELQQNHWYHSESAAVWLRDAQHCRFRRNTFTRLGGTALVMNGACVGNEVAANEVAHTGAGGFTINSVRENLYVPQKQADGLAHHNRVTDNHIHHIGEIWKHGAGVYIHLGWDNAVAHNYIHHTSRHPIIITFNSAGNVVEFNRLTHSNLETADTGAIHTYRTDLAERGNIIRNNVIGDAIGMHTNTDGEILTPIYAWGIYLDGFSSRAVVRNNIVYRCSKGGFMLNGGDGNIAENNIFVDGGVAQLTLNRLKRGDRYPKGVGNRLYRNVVSYSSDAAALRVGSGKGLDFAECDDNLLWRHGKPIPELEGLRRSGLETRSLVADPLFVDPDRDDYRLRPESPAFKLGFKPIDTTHVGPRGPTGAGVE